MTSFSTTAPSFTSFPDAPAFDSFPAQDGKKRARKRSRSRSERQDDNERTRRKDKRRSSPRDGREDATSSRKEHRAVETLQLGARASDSDDRMASSKRRSRHHGSERGDRPRDGPDRQSRNDAASDIQTSERKRHSERRDEKRRRRRSSSPNVRARNIISADEAPTSTLNVVASSSNQGSTSIQGVIGLLDRELYTLDRRGDQDVRQYGKLYRGSVPVYRRIGYGHIIGMTGEWKITKESAYAGQGLEIIAGRAGRSSVPRLADRKTVRLLIDRHRKQLRLAATADASGLNPPALDAERDFLPLRTEPVSSALENSGKVIRQAQARDDRSPGSDSGGLSEDDVEDEDEDGESYDTYVQRRNKNFQQHLRSHPNDTAVWLELAAFQDEVHNKLSTPDAVTSRHSRRVIPQAEKRTLAEVKISILERALAQPGNEASPALNLALLKYGIEIWEVSDAMKRWQSLLRTYPEERRFWLEYITFRQTRATVFTVQDTIEVYSDCMQRLDKAAQREVRNSVEREAIEENLLYLFLRACFLLRQAGYRERAIAALQGMMELNFYMPDVCKAGLNAASIDQYHEAIAKVLEDLETFWDSEVPRFGEEGARGWSNTSLDALTTNNEAPAATNDSAQDDDPFLLWCRAENTTSRKRSHPSRTQASEDVDDPYATVLFDDIRGLLFVVASPDSRSQLLYSVLIYLGLPVIPPDTSSESILGSDTFLHADDFAPSCESLNSRFWPARSPEDFLHDLLPFQIVTGEAMEPAKIPGVSTPFEPPFRTFPVSADSLFEVDPPWFSQLDHLKDVQPAEKGFLRAALAQMRTVSKDPFLTLIYFSVEAAISRKGAIKIAKRILKEDSRNLLLWDAYARIERSAGNLSAARNVYVQALSLSIDFSESEKVDLPLLWRAWAELEWENGATDSCLCVLSACAIATADTAYLERIASASVVSTTSQQLRARQHFSRQLALANSIDAPQSLYRHRVSIVFGLALLAYLTSGLEAASRVMNEQKEQLRAEARTSAEEEEIIALHAKIIYRHSLSRRAFRPGDLRSVLESGLRSYPNNSVFLSLHLHNELRTRIDNRVRTVLEEMILRPHTVSAQGWLFAIYAELHLNARRYNPESIRALFERAVDNERTRSSISIWALRINFELREGRLKKAKTYLLQAIVECPWAKDLYMLAFAPSLRHAFRSGELKRMHSLMLEKGIRLHHSLTEYLADWRSEESEEEDVGQEGPIMQQTEDDRHASREAADRLRLLPV